MNIENIIEQIHPLDDEKKALAKEYHDLLIKPLGSLGRIEEIAVQMAGITGKMKNDFKKRAILIFCADNGVHAEGVSTAPQSVTAMQAINMLEGKTGVSVLAKWANIDIKVVDIGINSCLTHKDLINEKIAYGTKNITREAAMTKEQMDLAIEIGISLVKKCRDDGYTLLGTGEMGICNTTTSQAIIIALTNSNVEDCAGKGAGLTEELFERKKDVLRKILALHYKKDMGVLEILRTMGGFDIAGLVGCFLGAAIYKIPIVIDGVISLAAALIAFHIAPLSREYMFPSHASAEKSYAIGAKKLCISPYFDLDMRLGEGSGCPFTMTLIDAAMAVICNMATFEEGNVDRSDYIDIREEK